MFVSNFHPFFFNIHIHPWPRFPKALWNWDNYLYFVKLLRISALTIALRNESNHNCTFPENKIIHHVFGDFKPICTQFDHLPFYTLQLNTVYRMTATTFKFFTIKYFLLVFLTFKYFFFPTLKIILQFIYKFKYCIWIFCVLYTDL